MQNSFHFWKKALPSEVASKVESYLEVNTWVDSWQLDLIRMQQKLGILTQMLYHIITSYCLQCLID